MKDQKEIIAANEKIARFMGSIVENGWVHLADGFQGQFTSSALIYHKSWDELMPVVNKIDGLYSKAFPSSEKFIEMILAKEHPIDSHYMDVVALPLATSLNEAYASIIKFIDWYNEQKS